MKKYYIFAVLVIASLSLFIVSNAKNNSDNLVIDGNRIVIHTSYAEVPVDVQIEEADVIVEGTVTDISKTRWNQDSGEYWEEVVTHDGVEQTRSAIAYYTISILVDRTLIGESNKSDLVEITIAGMSPLDHSDNDFPIEVESNVVILAAKSELAWRDGRRPTLKFLSAPEASLFQQRKNGSYKISLERKALSFDELVSKIATIRPDDIQR